MVDQSQPKRWPAAEAHFERELLALLPAQAQIVDIHTHLGHDEDGRSLDLGGLLAELDRAGVAKAATFPLHDPERVPAFRKPNKRVLAWANESGGRLIPFCRVDPAEEGVAEARRALAAGARGIKLHPRAQKVTFRGEQRAVVGELFRLAAEARVPVLIHAGRGLAPEEAPHFCALALEYPQTALILAHGAIWDQGYITTALRDHPLVLYDTSCFHPLDVVTLFEKVPPERILFGSDPPYGRPAGALYLLLRVAALFGLAEEERRLVLGGNASQLLERYELRSPGQPQRSRSLPLLPAGARLYAYLSAATGSLFGGAPERALESLDLALTVCAERGQDQVEGELLAVVGEAVLAAKGMVAEGQDGLRPAVGLLQRALVRAATTVAAPDP